MSSVQAAVRTAIASIGQGLYGVACSGGADSMALADAAIEVAGTSNVVVLTIDHGLNSQSAEVAAAVAAWARSRGAAAVVRRVQVVRRASIEAAARDARYAALAALSDQLGLVAILTGHTARDQAETVLLRLLRGSGPAGLAGIPARRPFVAGEPAAPAAAAAPAAPAAPVAARAHCEIVRPLLAIDRATIDTYVEARELPTWADPMNADRKIARVRVREDLLPLLRRENPQLDAALVRLAASASEWLAVIDSIAAPFARFPIDCSAIAKQPAAIRKRAVALALEGAGASYEAVHLDAIDRLVTQPSRGEKALDLPDGRFVRRYDAATFEGAWSSSDARTKASVARTKASDARTTTSDARTAASDARTTTSDARTAASDARTAASDARKNRSPALLASDALGDQASPNGLSIPEGCDMRIWQAGDRMRPARLRGKSRKLSDLYGDAKVPRASRSGARVIVRLHDAAIVWAEHVGIAHESVISDEERQELLRNPV